MSTRAEFAAHIRAFKPIPAGAVSAFDALADAMGIGTDAPMEAGQAAIDLIKRYEGLVLTAYPDPASGGDPWTIGYGSTGAGIHRGLRWTKEQATERMVSDVQKLSAQIRNFLGGSPTTQGEFDAMTSFAYNLGIGNLASSTLLRKHIRGDRAGAADEFARWNKAAGKVMTGLTVRRAAEAAVYRGRPA